MTQLDLFEMADFRVPATAHSAAEARYGFVQKAHEQIQPPSDCTLVFGPVNSPMTRRATFVSQVHATLIQVRVNGKLETVNSACVRRDQ